MPRNVEIKAKVRDPEGLAEKTKALAGNEGTTLIQEDTFFNATNGRLKMRCLKDHDMAKLIQYSRPDQDGPKLSDYSIALINNAEAENLKTVLAKAMGIKGEVKKTRQLIMVGQTRVHLDNVKGLGHFMELEVVLRDDQTVEEGQLIAEDIMLKLGIHQDDLLDGAYMDLLLKNA